MSACNKSCVGVYITPDGRWESGTFDSVNAVKYGKSKTRPVHIRPGEPYLYSKNKRVCKVDCALLCMHGILGEDGALQGLLEMSGIPYTGSGVSASALGMNKLLSKHTFEGAGLPVMPFMPVCREQYERDAYSAVKPVLDEIAFPAIVKPCNLGSSIGISIADNLSELYGALRVAFEWDDTVIVEKALTGFTEVNCAVLGDGYGGHIVSDTEQPVGWKNFLTFSDKYSGDVKSSRHKIPAEIDPETEEQVKEFAVKAFDAIGCAGVARVDFLLHGGNIYVNEINTIPGSLSHPLFKSQMNFSKLIDKLIEYAMLRKKHFERLKLIYTPIEPIVGSKK